MTISKQKTFRYGKIFLLALSLMVSGSIFGQNQKINLSQGTMTVKQVFRQIEKQTDLSVDYNQSKLNTNRKVTLKSRSQSLARMLNDVLAGTGYTYKIENGHILILPKQNRGIQTVQQSNNRKTVKGKVTDTNGEPIIGAGVNVKGTNISTVTDVDGNFELKVPEGSTLEITYIGFATADVKVGNKSQMDIQMAEDTKNLDEVVVVGYGTKKKINLTDAVAVVDGKDIVKTSTSKITNAIAGRLPGVMAWNSSGEPGTGSTLSIRGYSTMNDNSPLIVVDGIPRESFDQFDPNEIESITVLKDGAAAAIYGARANNGVFLVTTKHGSKGKFNVGYNGTLSIQSKTKYPAVMNAYQFATTMNEALDNMGYDRNNPAQAGRYYSDEDIEKYKNGELGGDWYDATFKKNYLMQNHNVTVAGGSDIVKYFFSGTILNQDGMYDNMNYKAYKFRSNIDADITKILRVGMNLEGRYEIKKTPAVGAYNLFHYATKTLPTLRPYYPDGKPINTAGMHPAEEVKSGYARTRYNTFYGTLNFNLKLDAITKGLYATGNASFGKYHHFVKNFYKTYMMYTEDENGNVISTKSNGGLNGKTALTEQYAETHSVFWNLGLHYQRTIGKHDFSGLLLYEQNKEKGDSFGGTKQDFPIDTKDELFVSGSENMSFTGSSSVNDARKSLVTRLGYVYDTKYLFEFSLRADASYKFPKHKRWGYFPSFSAGWRISEEKFFKDCQALNFIDNLKLRASYAQVGNDKVGAYQWQDAYTITSNYGPVYNGVAQSLIYYGVYPNGNITWETANNYNVGLDADFWRGLLSVEFDYFYKKTKDILWSRSRSVPATFGRSLPNENYAEMQNQGFEVALTHNNHIGKVNYNLRFTASYAKDKVTKIDDPENAMDFEKQINRPLGFIVGYKSLGLFQSQEEADNYMNGYQFGIKTLAGDIKYADINNDNVIDSKDRTVLSENGAMPRFMYGLSGNLNWNGIDFSFLLQGAAARNIMLSGAARETLPEGENSYVYLLDAWSENNKDAKYPLLWVGKRSMNDRDSNFWMRNGAYLRLKNIVLGYTLPRTITQTIGMQSVRFFVSGENLLTFTPLKEYDPEVGSADGNYYPQQKMVSFGVNVSF